MALDITTRGKSVQPLKFLMVDDANNVVAAYGEQGEQLTELDFVEETTEEYLLRVWNTIEANPDSHARKASLFFFDYDLSFCPILWANLDKEGATPHDWVYHDMFPTQESMQDLEPKLDLLSRHLADRINQRTTGAQPSYAGGVEAVIELSALQLALFDYYQYAYHMTVANDIGRGFDRFASGDLRLPFLSSGTLEPDSGYFFMFAEFALLAMDLNVDAVKWKNRCRAMLRAQEVMAMAYAPQGLPGPQRHYESYDPKNYSKAPCSSKIDSLKNKYQNLDKEGLGQQATTNVQALMGRGFV